MKTADLCQLAADLALEHGTGAIEIAQFARISLEVDGQNGPRENLENAVSASGRHLRSAPRSRPAARDSLNARQPNTLSAFTAEKVLPDSVYLLGRECL